MFPPCFEVVRVGSLVDYPVGAAESLLRQSISSVSSLSFCFFDCDSGEMLAAWGQMWFDKVTQIDRELT